MAVDTPIGRALGIPSAEIFKASQPAAIGIATYVTVDGLLDFPTGADDKFVILSTGDATRVDAPTGYSKDGTDWSSKGPIADDVSLTIMATVPAKATQLKLDFMFLTQEEPGTSNQSNDFFKVTARADGGAEQTLVNSTVNNEFYLGSTQGTVFKHRSLLKTINYKVPAGASTITFSLTLGDVGDGKGDTAVFLDNLRFEEPKNKIYFNFEGGVSTKYGPDTTVTMPAFQVTDLGYPAGTDRATVINEIVNDVKAKFAGYEISFVTTKPTSGEYTTVFVGGNASAPVKFGPGADPKLIKRWGTSTILDAGVRNGILYGQTFGGVDIGNYKLDQDILMFPQSFLISPKYPTTSPDKRVDFLAAGIAHEIGHALGLRHVQNATGDVPNLMKVDPPVSDTATFEDINRDLVSSESHLWTDGATQLNTAAYLRSILGTTTSSVDLGVSPRALSKWIQAQIGLIFGGSIYNAYLGVIPGQPLLADETQDSITPITIKTGTITGNQFLQIPVSSMADKLVFWGQSTPNGPIDIFSGPPVPADFDMADYGVPLFDADGNLVTQIPTSTGVPGSLQAGPALGIKPSEFTIPLLLPFGTYQDENGKSYTVSLKSKTGTGGFTMLDPDGDGKGPIDTIYVQGTTVKDKLSITGQVEIGAIVGTTIGTIDAKSADLVGDGIEFGNLIGALTLHDVLNGADIAIGGGETAKTKFTAHVIGDGTLIDSDSTISKFTAAAVGDGEIRAPAIGSLKITGDKAASITGDFRSDMTLAHNTPFLTAALVKKPLLGSATIAGTVLGANLQVDGSVGKFKTARFVNSSLAVESFLQPAKLASFTATGFKGSELAAFENSHIAANIVGSVKLASINTANGGVPFGVAVRDSIGSVSGVLLPDDTSFAFDKKNPAAQGAGDFVVTLNAALLSLLNEW